MTQNKTEIFSKSFILTQFKDQMSYFDCLNPLLDFSQENSGIDLLTPHSPPTPHTLTQKHTQPGSLLANRITIFHLQYQRGGYITPL